MITWYIIEKKGPTDRVVYFHKTGGWTSEKRLAKRYLELKEATHIIDGARKYFPGERFFVLETTMNEEEIEQFPQSGGPIGERSEANQEEVEGTKNKDAVGCYEPWLRTILRNQAVIMGTLNSMIEDPIIKRQLEKWRNETCLLMEGVEKIPKPRKVL